MLAKAYSATPRGVDALFVTVEVDRIRAHNPSTIVVGLPDTAVREARERIFAAIRHLGRRSEAANVVINLAPADQRKEGAVLDLPMAMAFLATTGDVSPEALAGRLLLGELSLEGKLQPVRGVLPIVLAARDRGYSEVILPAANFSEARGSGWWAPRPSAKWCDISGMGLVRRFRCRPRSILERSRPRSSTSPT
jgi:magnesium chelatase family protein